MEAARLKARPCVTLHGYVAPVWALALTAGSKATGFCTGFLAATVVIEARGLLGYSQKECRASRNVNHLGPR